MPEDAHTVRYPDILRRYVDEEKPSQEHLPRAVRKRFHGIEVQLWEGRVHVDDIDGWVENTRLKHYLNQWRERRDDGTAHPTTDDIYDIMIEADQSEPTDGKKPFHINRIARNIAINDIQDPVIIFSASPGKIQLWDGNRRFYGTKHIMRENKFRADQDRAQWIPALVYEHSGDVKFNEKIKHAVITEFNFAKKDHIPWPAYVKAEQVCHAYDGLIHNDPGNPTVRREAKEQVATDYSLKGWRVVDRWIKMYELSGQFKEYHEETKNRDGIEVDLQIQDKFEYFDELSKPGVWGSLRKDLDAQGEVFNWLWDGKFKAFADVRRVPAILSDPVARRQANADDGDGVKRAIATVIANDPTRSKDKEAADEKIKQFAEWLNSFRREDYRKLEAKTLQVLENILNDVVRMLRGLLGDKK